MMDEKELEMYRFIKCALDAGATVKKVEPGEGGISICGKNLSDEELIQLLFNPPLPTNADRIRSMTDEELAEWIADHTNCVDCNLVARCKGMNINCNYAWLSWLKEESKQ